MSGMEVAIVVIALIVLFLGVRTVRIVPQARVGIIQRLGNYQRTAEAGVTINVTAVVYYQILDPKNATYQVANVLAAMEQLTQTTLRNVMGGLTLDTSLTSRDMVNAQLRMVLDEVTEKWGIRVNRVELKDIAPPKDIQIAMEKQMQAERQKRAAILRAEGEAQALVTVQSAQAKAIELVFGAVNGSNPSTEAMAYQYLQMLPRLAENPANKVLVVPTDYAGLAGLAATLSNLGADGAKPYSGDAGARTESAAGG